MTLSIDPPSSLAPPEAWADFIAKMDKAAADGDEGAKYWADYGRAMQAAAEERAKK